MRKLVEEVAQYYGSKVERHGPTPRGVDWNDASSQWLRFEKLATLIDQNSSFSVNDLGCGYGAFLDFLESRFTDFEYNGQDIATEMIRVAKERRTAKESVRFTVSSLPEDIADFGFASGIFNVRLSRSLEEWESYLLETLDQLDRTSKRGFAFNCLTSYSDEEKKRGDLYYADPCTLFYWCKRQYSRHVALLHDYGLYEFTILVRKEL